MASNNPVYDQVQTQKQQERIRNPEENSPFTDLLAGQSVYADTGGQWGQPGTAAAETNAQQQGQGAAENAFQKNEGASVVNRTQGLGAQAGAAGGQAADVGISNANNSLTAARDAQFRAGPATDWNPAQQTQGGTQQTIDALNSFAANSANSPSAAQAVANQTQSQGVGQALALARSGRGMGGNAAATGQAQGTIAQTNASAAAQGSQIAANEDAAAKGRTLAALNSSLGGGLGLGQQQSTNAQFDTNTALATRGQNDAATQANNQNALGWAGYGTGAQQGFMGLQQGYEGQGINANLGHQQLGSSANIQHQQLGQNALNSQADYDLQQKQLDLDAQKANQANDAQRDSANAGLVSSALGAIGMSDKRAKTEIERLREKDSSLGKALSTLGNAPGFSYKYKNPDQPGAAHGTQVSSMAQDLEGGPLGSRVVHETPQGKMVNYTEVMKMTPGAITELNRKVSALEKALGGGRRAAHA